MNIKIIFLSTLLFFSHAAVSDTIYGRVVGVSDGDTVTVLDQSNKQYKIRLSGIDAPEKSQGFGQVSKRSLSDLIYNKNVSVDWQKQDRYGRYLGKILIGGQDVNLLQIEYGMAWFYRAYQSELTSTDRVLYQNAESVAQAKIYGLWSDPNSIPPWQYRRQSK